MFGFAGVRLRIVTGTATRATTEAFSASRTRRAKSLGAPRGVAQMVRVLVWGTRGRRFESCLPDSQPIAVW